MWKVEIVDDSYPVLQFLEKMIPWDTLGMRISGLHQNGEEALRHCLQEMPHLLITDIGMPYMDGIQLTRALKQRNPELKVIILSCHDEFHYAQQAVKLNVNDYILKETMEPEALLEVLQASRAQLEEEARSKNSQERTQTMLKMNTALLKEGFIRSTVADPMSDPSRWSAAAQEFGIDLVRHTYVPVLCYANRYRDMKKRYLTEELFKYTFAHVIHELVDQTGHGISMPYGTNDIILLIPAGKQTVPDGIVPYLKDVQREAAKVLKTELSFMLAQSVRQPESLKHQLKLLAESKDQRFYSGTGVIYPWKPFGTAEEDIYKLFSEVLDRFKQVITVGTKEKTDETFAALEEWLRGRRYQAEKVRGFIIKLLSDIELKYRSLQHFQNVYSSEIFHHTLAELETLDELLAYVREYLQVKIDYEKMAMQESQRDEIVAAKKYVATHLSSKISMEEVARGLHLNASHFSRIFKSETGETFVEFVTRMKMEHAAQYLLQTEHSVEQIADMLGYDNTSYFIKVFKGFYGMPPVQYRKEK